MKKDLGEILSKQRFLDCSYSNDIGNYSVNICAYIISLTFKFWCWSKKD